MGNPNPRVFLVLPHRLHVIGWVCPTVILHDLLCLLSLSLSSSPFLHLYACNVISPAPPASALAIHGRGGSPPPIFVIPYDLLCLLSFITSSAFVPATPSLQPRPLPPNHPWSRRLPRSAAHRCPTRAPWAPLYLGAHCRRRPPPSTDSPPTLTRFWGVTATVNTNPSPTHRCLALHRPHPQIRLLDKGGVRTGRGSHDRSSTRRVH
jgi:hypothetical protein